MKKLKGLLVIVFFIVIVSGFYYFKDLNSNHEEFSYRDEFHHLDREFWYVGEWKTMFKAYKEVDIKNDVLNLAVTKTDRGPFLLSKSIPVKQGDVITVKRRVKYHYGNDKFCGGMSIVETNDSGLKPMAVDSEWGKSLGQPLGLVEYVHFYSQDMERPGRDNFRILGPGWKQNDNYALLEPTFDEWFEEKLVIDTRNDEITYSYGDNEVKVKGKKLTKSYIKVFMHSYGWRIGHSMKLDWIDISVQSPKD